MLQIGSAVFVGLPHALYFFFARLLVGNVQKLNHEFLAVLGGLHFVLGLCNGYFYHIRNKFEVYSDFALRLDESFGRFDIDDAQLGGFDLNERWVTLKIVPSDGCLLVRVSSAWRVYWSKTIISELRSIFWRIVSFMLLLKTQLFINSFYIF